MRAGHNAGKVMAAVSGRAAKQDAKLRVEPGSKGKGSSMQPAGRRAHLAQVGRLVALLAQHVEKGAQLGLMNLMVLEGAHCLLQHVQLEGKNSVLDSRAGREPASRCKGAKLSWCHDLMTLVRLTKCN